MTSKDRLFISGAAGVIGSEMLASLANRPEIDVLAADRKSDPIEFKSNIKYWQGDLNNITYEELRDFAPTKFIHLAATFERSVESFEFWNDNFKNNVKLSHHLLSLISQLPSMKKIVFASSYLIYDPRQYQFEIPRKNAEMLEENAPINPRNLVGMAKLSHEKELEFFNSFYGEKFETLAVRIFRGYGRGSRDVISRWVRDLLQHKEINLYNLEGVFDYIYAKDSAQGLLELALKSSLTGVVNLGTGKGNSVQEIVNILKKFFPNLKSNIIESRPPYESSAADLTLLKTGSSWEPNYDLENGIKEIIEFERNQLPNKKLQNKLKILVTSSSKKVPLIQAIQSAARDIDSNIKVIAGDSNSNAITRYVSDLFWQMPTLSEDELDNIVNYCVENDVGLIIPTRDTELLYWSKHKNTFSKFGIEVLISSEHTIDTCLDKLKFAEFLSKKSLNSIQTSTQIESLISVARFAVKERFGSGSKDIGLGLSSEEATKHSLKLKNPIFQEFITGTEISADIWIIPEVFQSVVLRYRTVIQDGESQITKVFRNLKFEKQLLDLALQLEIRGPAVFQSIIDGEDNLHIIECNPRFGGASTASNAAGSRVLRKMILNSLRGEKGYSVSKSEEIRDLVQVRVPTDVYLHDFDF